MSSHVPMMQSQLPSVLLTDWYQLSMLDAYYRLGMEQTAIFEFFVRRLPEQNSFLVAAGWRRPKRSSSILECAVRMAQRRHALRAVPATSPHRCNRDR